VAEGLLVDVDFLQKRDELVFLEIADLGGRLDLGQLDLPAWIAPTPALSLGEGEDLRGKL
jgi:hypothetical protein